MAEDGKPYEVGYRRPPKATRFQPGQSGNRKGRPKGAQNLATLIQQELQAKITINENGKRRTITKAAGISKQLVNKNLAGNFKHIELLLEPTDSSGSQSAPRHDWSNDADQAVMAALFDRIRGPQPPAPAAPEIEAPEPSDEE